MEIRASKKRKQRAALVKKELKEKSSSDRFSDLPYEILEHIFSFLPIKSIAQTTLLSKHWNLLSLWRSHPHLDFYPLSPEPDNPHPDFFPRIVRIPRQLHEHQCKATEFVPIVLSRRQQDSNITTFRLFGHVSYSCLRKCIKHVMKHRIEQLELDVYLDCCFSLPLCLFKCKTLKVLTLNHQKKEPDMETGVPFGLVVSYKQFYYDTSGGLPFVHTLSLTNVYFKYGSDLFSGEKFPLLRELWLKNCKGMRVLNINCPCLEILKLEDLWLKDLGISGVGLLELRAKNCYRYARSSAKILAPCLQCLYWENNGNVEFTAESFRDINTGFLFFRINIPDAATLNRASMVLSALCFARSLSVGSQVLETLSKIDSEGGLSYSFNNLMTLELQIGMTKDEITGITCLLRSSPILYTIILSVKGFSKTRNESWNEKRHWKSQIHLKSIELHLKVARIDVEDFNMHNRAVYLTLSKIDSEGGLPCSFNNLMILELHIDMTDDDITGITCLLRRSPILHTITISVNSCSNTGDKGTGALINLWTILSPLALSTLVICSLPSTIFLVYGKYKQWLHKIVFVNIRESVANGFLNPSFNTLYRTTQQPCHSSPLADYAASPPPPPSLSHT
ncbi:hypothetical protein Vadar_012506 [Vaccinium darrowii]|uniref:Uncharacterized protein n=1 Tax=Vaccinium darrowii TaxID=229202 RepID=A0ACB7Z3L4_9ERIC|nr:hypothetical protein Vadar_012506 [Vaccinium darrowii]